MNIPLQPFMWQFRQHILDIIKHFIGKDMRLEQVSLRKTDAVKELLEFYMGKNTMERQNFIIDNLVIEEDLAS